jgi:NADH-quinone oxidoreductase subunit G
VRAQARFDRSAAAQADRECEPVDATPELPDGLRLGAVPALFASPTVEHSPSLRFLAPRQRAELSPADAERLGIGPGDEVEVSAGDRKVRAIAALRAGVRPGSVFLLLGTGDDGANALTNGLPKTVEVRRA